MRSSSTGIDNKKAYNFMARRLELTDEPKLFKILALILPINMPFNHIQTKNLQNFSLGNDRYPICSLLGPWHARRQGQCLPVERPSKHYWLHLERCRCIKRRCTESTRQARAPIEYRVFSVIHCQQLTVSSNYLPTPKFFLC